MQAIFTTTVAILGRASLGPKTVAAACLVSFLSLAGCGGSDDPKRVPLHGAVRVDGRLVTSGSLTLLPAQDNSGPAASTAIVDGRYEFTRTTGPVAGAHRVVLGVVASEETASGSERTADQRQSSGAAIKSAPAAPVKQSGSRGESSTTTSQRETRLDVPSQGDYRVDLEFAAD